MKPAVALLALLFFHPLLYPEYRFLLGQGVANETPAFLRELIAQDLPARALVKPGFAMLTQRLAEHYGITGVTGVEVRKVALPADRQRVQTQHFMHPQGIQQELQGTRLNMKVNGHGLQAAAAKAGKGAWLPMFSARR